MCMCKVLYLYVFIVAILFAACSDDSNSIDYLFDREISDVSVLRNCASNADSLAYCFMLRYRYPIDTDKLSKIYLWIDSTIIGDSTKSIDDDKLAHATDSFEYPTGTQNNFDTIDLTNYIKDYVKERDSLLVAIYCEYSSGRQGTVQRIYLHFGDDMAPSLVSLYDSVWTTGALFEWSRPSDQTDFYKPGELSGKIIGYNIVLHTENKDEDIRNLKILLYAPFGTDFTGKSIYKRHARVHSNNDSVWVDSVAHGDNTKNYLRLAILDGFGYNNEFADSNAFRMIIEGLKPESRYTIGISSWDSSGNSSGTEGVASVSTHQLFITTDSIAPLMPRAIFTLKDSLFPELARLDSNNRLRIFWSASVDPFKKNNGIKVDSVLTIPDTCLYKICYDTVANYMIEHYSAIDGWKSYSYAGGLGRYAKRYEISGDTMEVSAVGTFVTDTIRWVSPGDTIILRIRSIDKSGYYSVALLDTIYVSPGELAKQIECPAGFVPVSVADTSVFCMERFEHMNSAGNFINNVMHSEAKAACESISANGFKVALCNERDWELVCLSGGTLSYGVIQEETSDASEFLFADCNVATNDSSFASDILKRNSRCLNPMGVRDLPGNYQEWAMGRSKDTLAVLKGGSFKIMSGLDRESQALCTNRSFPYFTRLAYTTDTVYLYREGTKVDTVFEADTSRTLFKKLTQKDFRDTLQFFDVKDSNGNSIGTDYAPYAEYKRGGDKWLKELSNGLNYVPSNKKVVFFTGERTQFRGASSFYKSPSIGFRCCAYKE